LRAWEARVSDIVYNGTSIYYQSTRFGGDNSGLSLNGRVANGDSGSPVFNAAGELVGINDSASLNTSPSGTSTFLKFTDPSLRQWIEANTKLPPPVLNLATAANATAMRLTWNADAIGYRLQTSETLSSWTNVGDLITAPGTLDDPIADRPRRYYRLAKR